MTMTNGMLCFAGNNFSVDTAYIATIAPVTYKVKAKHRSTLHNIFTVYNFIYPVSCALPDLARIIWNVDKTCPVSLTPHASAFTLGTRRVLMIWNIEGKPLAIGHIVLLGFRFGDSSSGYILMSWYVRNQMHTKKVRGSFVSWAGNE